MIKVIRLYSDNFDGTLLTPEAYDMVKCEMSTGDYHTHKIIFTEVEDYSNVITPDILMEEAKILALTMQNWIGNAY